MRFRRLYGLGTLGALAAVVVLALGASGAGASRGDDQLSKIDHIVVIYEENHSFDNLYTTGSDAVGLTQGYYDTRALPIYQYLHSGNHPHYAIADDFFQSAFGGSFLNHQWLIAAASPVWPGAPVANHSIIDSNGMPTAYPLYTPTGPVLDRQLTQLCPSAVPNRACGDYAVNTIQPAFQPFKGSPQLPPQTGNTIGDELSKADVSWAWYAGGWSNADGDVGAPGWTNGFVPGVCADPDSSPNPAWPYCPNKVFQYHHQPFNYFAAFDPSTPAGLANRQAHLKDEAEFRSLVGDSSKSCQLDSVSFVKPIGLENEHPGYTSEPRGSSHLVDLLQAIQGSACAKDTMVIVTYDEFGGQWDHVSPPGQGGTAGPHDEWGPGTRIPALIVSPFLRGNFVVDHTQYDTTSILATIEHRVGVVARRRLERRRGIHPLVEGRIVEVRQVGVVGRLDPRAVQQDVDEVERVGVVGRPAHGGEVERLASSSRPLEDLRPLEEVRVDGDPDRREIGRDHLREVVAELDVAGVEHRRRRGLAGLRSQRLCRRDVRTVERIEVVVVEAGHPRRQDLVGRRVAVCTVDSR